MSIGRSPSGKAPGFDPGIRRFESCPASFSSLLFTLQEEGFLPLERDLLIFSGRSNPRFTSNICEHLQVELGRLQVVRFSDGELSVEIGDNVRGRDVFIVQSTCNPGNDHLMELLVIIDALRRASAWRITAVIPYFGYARQDRKLKPRVPITAKLVANLIATAGAHRVLTMDLHAGQIVGFFDIPVDNLISSPVIYQHFKEEFRGKDLTVVAPDVGGVERARFLAKKFNAPIAIIDKRRSGPNQVAEMNVVGEVEGRVCIITDDMIDTGGTLIKAAESLREKGASDVLASCVHPVLSGTAVERVRESTLSKLLVTDTIPLQSEAENIEVVSVTSLFADAINNIYRNDSVSSLFS